MRGQHKGPSQLHAPVPGGSEGKGLTLAVAHLLEGGLVAQGILSRLDNEGKTGSNGLG